MEGYSVGYVMQVHRPETISRLIFKQREKYDRLQTGHCDGMIEPFEETAIIATLDILDAINRLPHRQYCILIDWLWYARGRSGATPSDAAQVEAARLDVNYMIARYHFTSEENMRGVCKGIVEKVARWAGGRYKDDQKPPLQRNETLSELIENIF